MGRLLTGLVGRRLSGAGLAYAGAEEVGAGIGAAGRMHEGVFEAQSFGDLSRADAERMQAFDSQLFGLGRVYRYGIEHVGTAFGVGHTVDERKAVALEADTQDALAKEHYAREQARIAAATEVAQQTASLPTALPSVRLAGAAAAATKGAAESAANAREQLALEMTRQTDLLHEKRKRGDVTDAEYKRLAGVINDTETAREKSIAQEEAAAKAAAAVDTARSDIAKRDESVARAGGRRAGATAGALLRGPGGEDTGFRLGQEQEEEEMKRKVAKGEATPEQLAGLQAQQGEERVRRERDIRLRIQGETTEWAANLLTIEGKFYEARKARFEQSAAERLNAVRNKSKEEVDAVKDQINAERKLMEQQHEWEMAAVRAAAALAVQISGGRARASTLRARGEFFRAGEKDFQTSWDARLQEAASAYANEHDAERKQAAQDRYVALLGEHDAAVAERRGLQARDISLRGEQVGLTELRAQGKDYTAHLREIRQHADREFAEARGNTALQQKIREQEAADVKQEQFELKRAGMNRAGEAVRHGFEVDFSGRLLGRNPLENIGDVVKEGNGILRSIDTWLKQQVALAGK